jgi:hypothetical protein
MLPIRTRNFFDDWLEEVLRVQKIFQFAQPGTRLNRPVRIPSKRSPLLPRRSALACSPKLSDPRSRKGGTWVWWTEKSAS